MAATSSSILPTQKNPTTVLDCVRFSAAFQERTNSERQPFGTLREHLAQLHASGLDGVFICFGPLPASAKQVGDERRPIWQVAGNGCPGKTPVQTWNARPPVTQKGPDSLVE